MKSLKKKKRKRKLEKTQIGVKVVVVEDPHTGSILSLWNQWRKEKEDGEINCNFL